MDIAINLKKYRKVRNLSIKDIAVRVGVAESTYRDWENGRKIQGEPYQKLSDALGIDVLTLLNIKSPGNDFVKKQLLMIEECVKNIRKIEMWIKETEVS